MMRTLAAAVAATLPTWPAVAAPPTPPPGPPPPPPPAIVVIGASYIAKQLCSCIFVAGRAEAPCRAEFKLQIGPFAVTVGPTRVTAALGPVAAQADFDRTFGCVLVR